MVHCGCLGIEHLMLTSSGNNRCDLHTTHKAGVPLQQIMAWRTYFNAPISARFDLISCDYFDIVQCFEQEGNYRWENELFCRLKSNCAIMNAYVIWHLGRTALNWFNGIRFGGNCLLWKFIEKKWSVNVCFWFRELPNFRSWNMEIKKESGSGDSDLEKVENSCTNMKISENL